MSINTTESEIRALTPNFEDERMKYSINDDRTVITVELNEASSGNSELLYANRDPMELDAAGDYYCRHVSAMTKEGLHNKAAIAAELAYRDAVIDFLMDFAKFDPSGLQGIREKFTANDGGT